MDDELNQVEASPAKQAKRPVLLTMLCIFSFVFFGFFSFQMLAGLFFSNLVAEVTRQYVPEYVITAGQTRMLFIAGFLLHLASFAGTWFIWTLRKKGYYLIAISSLIIASFQLFNPAFSVTSTAVYFFFIISFGIFINKFQR